MAESIYTANLKAALAARQKEAERLGNNYVAPAPPLPCDTRVDQCRRSALLGRFHLPRETLAWEVSKRTYARSGEASEKIFHDVRDLKRI